MRSTTVAKLDMSAIEAMLGPSLTAEQAKEIYALGPEAVVFALLSLAQRLAVSNACASTPDPATPSSQVPPFQKPPGKRRRKPRGAKAGHIGHRRKPPPKIDRRESHVLSQCPKCQGPVRRCQSTRTRIIEDIPEHITPVVTEHTIPRYWCPQCKEVVEPVVTDALPGSSIGLRVVALSAWLHYLLGVTLSRNVEVFDYHLQFPLTAGGLVQMWHRLAERLKGWYEEIRSQALNSAVLHADETGWRVNGESQWLWCFTARSLTYYMIDKSRGSPGLKKMLRKEFNGVLVSDFLPVYNKVVCAAKQKCLPHLLRELKQTERRYEPDGDWLTFARRLKRLVRDAIRLSKDRPTLSESKFADKRLLLQQRLDTLIKIKWQNKHSRRLRNRLKRHRTELLTFLDNFEVPFDNNQAERQLRPAVIARKNSYANGSAAGAETQSILMTVFATLKQRGLNPISTVLHALKHSLQTGQLPPLPSNTTEIG